MSFQMGIGSLGGTMFFEVGLCTPLRTMCSLLHLQTTTLQSKFFGLNFDQPLSYLLELGLEKFRKILEN